MTRPSVKLLLFAAVFAGTVLTAAVPRLFLNPVFDETFLSLKVKRFAVDNGISSPEAFFQKYANDIWRPTPSSALVSLDDGTHYYRPLQRVLNYAFLLNDDIFHSRPQIPIVLNALVLGLAAGLFYLLGLRLTGHQGCALGAVFLFVFSIPALAATWVVSTNAHAHVFCLLGAEFLAYLHLRKSGRWLWGLMLAGAAFLAPLFKEYAVVGPLVLLGYELICPDRKKGLVALTALLFLHAVFPAFLIRLVCYHDLSLFSPLNSHLSSGPGHLRMDISGLLIFSVPPLLSLLAVNALLLGPRGGTGAWRGVTAVLGGLGYAALFISGGALQPWAHYASFGLLLLITAGAFRIHPFLAVWFFFSWLSFPKVLYNTVHLYYAILPLSLILLWYARQTLNRLLTSWGKGRAARVVMAMIWGVIFADQGLQSFQVYQAFAETGRSARRIARCIRASAREGRPVALISSTLLGVDVEYAYDTWFQGEIGARAFTIERNSLKPEEKLLDREAFFRFLSEVKGTHDVFLLDIDAYPSRLSRWISEAPAHYRLIDSYTMDRDCPYADILRAAVPTGATLHPAPPDMIDFFFFEKRPFVEKLYGGQKLYQLAD